jgi:hypothetical protein
MHVLNMGSTLSSKFRQIAQPKVSCNSGPFCRGQSFRLGGPPGTLQEIIMKKTLTALTAAAIIGGTLVASVSDADAQWRRRGGWGPGLAAGIIGGAIITGAILASRPRGYVAYEGYGQPVSGPGCYWSAQPVYDYRGRVVGYTGQPVQVCPGYQPY